MLRRRRRRIAILDTEVASADATRVAPGSVMRHNGDTDEWDVVRYRLVTRFDQRQEGWCERSAKG